MPSPALLGTTDHLLHPWTQLLPSLLLLAGVCGVAFLRAWRIDRNSGTRGLPLTAVSCTLFALSASLFLLSERGQATYTASQWLWWTWVGWMGVRYLKIPETLQLRSQPPSAATPSTLVGVLWTDRRSVEAEVLANALLAENPSDNVARLYLSGALWFQQRREEARTHLDRVDRDGLSAAEKETCAGIWEFVGYKVQPPPKPPSLLFWPLVLAVVGLLGGSALAARLGIENSYLGAGIPCAAALVAFAASLAMSYRRRAREAAARASAPVVVLVMEALCALGRPDLALQVGEARLRVHPGDEGVRVAISGARGEAGPLKGGGST